MTYLVHWIGVQTDVKVMRFKDAAAASNYLGKMPEDRNGCVLDTENDFPVDISKTVLARLYNALSPTQINTFSNRGAGMQRVWQAVVAKGTTVPITTTTEIKVSEITTEEEKPKRTRVTKSETGEFKPVRDGSSLATILKHMNGKHTFEEIGARAGIEGGVFSATDKTKHRVKHVLRVDHGIDHVADDAGRIMAVFPEGHSLKDAIVSAHEKKAPKAKAAKTAEAEANQEAA